MDLHIFVILFSFDSFSNLLSIYIVINSFKHFFNFAISMGHPVRIKLNLVTRILWPPCKLPYYGIPKNSSVYNAYMHLDFCVCCQGVRTLTFQTWNPGSLWPICQGNNFLIQIGDVCVQYIWDVHKNPSTNWPKLCEWN